MFKKLLPPVINLLKQNNITIIVVDIGSRNGILECADLAEFIEAYGFEPNPEEYTKLILGKTDAFLAAGIKSPEYLKLSYLPFAIGNKDGVSDFYLTPAPGAAGLLEPNLERLCEIKWKGRTYQRSFGEDIFQGYKKIKVEVKSLDSFAAEQSIDHIDYLKIDTEGSEYEVLEGAKNILKKTGVIKVEVCFIPFRRGQRLFSHIDLLLRDIGFDLLRYEIDPIQIGYKERLKAIEYIPSGFADPYGQPLSGDAIYVNRKISDPKKLIAQAVILLERNYIDETLHILKTGASLEDKEFLRLLEVVEIKKIRRFGYFIVDKTLDIIKTFRKLLL